MFYNAWGKEGTCKEDERNKSKSCFISLSSSSNSIGNSGYFQKCPYLYPLIDAIENNLQKAYAFYNKSAKRQHRLRELMEMSHNQKSMEDIAIETLEHAVKESLKEGILFYQDYNLLIYRRRRIEKDSSFEIEKVEYNPLARTTIMFRSNM